VRPYIIRRRRSEKNNFRLAGSFAQKPTLARKSIEVTERLLFPSASLPRWRTGGGVAGHKLVGHAE